jgi:hypothetical protein
MPLFKAREERRLAQQRLDEEIAANDRAATEALKKRTETIRRLESIFASIEYEGSRVRFWRSSPWDERQFIVYLDLLKSEQPDDLGFIDRLQEVLNESDASVVVSYEPYGEQTDSNGRTLRRLTFTFELNPKRANKSLPPLREQYKALRAKLARHASRTECEFCGLMYDSTEAKCPHCGAPRGTN